MNAIDPATEDLTEPSRLDDLSALLLERLMRFERAFADLAIDELGLTDQDVRRMADTAEAIDPSDPECRAFAFLLRHVTHERAMRSFRRALQRDTASASDETRGDAPPSDTGQPTSGTHDACRPGMMEPSAPWTPESNATRRVDPVAEERSNTALLDLVAFGAADAGRAQLTQREWARLAILAIDQSGAPAAISDRIAAELGVIDLDLASRDDVGQNREGS